MKVDIRARLVIEDRDVRKNPGETTIELCRNRKLVVQRPFGSGVEKKIFVKDHKTKW